MQRNVPTLTIFGVPVARLSLAQARDAVARLLAEPAPATLVYVSAHSLNLARRDAEYRRALLRADLVLNDGSGVALAARMRGTRFPHNLNGSDFTPEILHAVAERELSVYLLGGPPGVTERAARRLRETVPSLRIAGCHHGYLSRAERARVAGDIRASGADVLVVAMGNPLQELYLTEYLERTGVRLGVGVGAFLDFVTERHPRAPLWMRRAGVEWVHRLVLEPGRMWRRYLLGNPEFLFRALTDRVRSGGVPLQRAPRG